MKLTFFSIVENSVTRAGRCLSPFLARDKFHLAPVILAYPGRQPSAKAGICGCELIRINKFNEIDNYN
jgi:hypothetical protein